jgi:prevent-host-death family protein
MNLCADDTGQSSIYFRVRNKSSGVLYRKWTEPVFANSLRAAYCLTRNLTKKELLMRTVSLAAAKAHFSELVAQVASGQEVVITRHGQPIVRLSALAKTKAPISSREGFRARLPRQREPSAKIIRAMRDDEA